jgi:Ca-activated chloride channel homolog
MQVMASESALSLNRDRSRRQAQPHVLFAEVPGSRYLAMLLLLATSCLSLNCYAQSAAFAANTPAASPSALPTISKQVQEVNLVLTVTNWLGHFVKDLNEGDVRILDNGQPAQRITYFENQTNLPLRVGILVDVSSSVTNRFQFELKSAGAFLRRVLRPSSDLALLVGFNHDIQLLQDFTNSPELLTGQMTRLVPGGETAIYDAVAFACTELAKLNGSQPSRRALILMTDGGDNRSHISLDQAIEAALRSDTIVYVLSTNPDYSLSLREPGEVAMKELAQATGGRLMRAGTNDDVSRAFSKIDRELRNQYAIGYKPPLGQPDGLFHRLVVLGPKRLHIYHRQGYFAAR